MRLQSLCVERCSACLKAPTPSTIGADEEGLSGGEEDRGIDELMRVPCQRHSELARMYKGHGGGLRGNLTGARRRRHGARRSETERSKLDSQIAGFRVTSTAKEEDRRRLSAAPRRGDAADRGKRRRWQRWQRYGGGSGCCRPSEGPETSDVSRQYLPRKTYRHNV